MHNKVLRLLIRYDGDHTRLSRQAEIFKRKLTLRSASLASSCKKANEISQVARGYRCRFRQIYPGCDPWTRLPVILLFCRDYCYSLCYSRQFVRWLIAAQHATLLHARSFHRTLHREVLYTSYGRQVLCFVLPSIMQAAGLLAWQTNIQYPLS